MAVLEFACGWQHFALPLAYVHRVLHSARPVPLPGAPDIVLGVLNVGGDTVTVLDFGLRAGCAPTVLIPAQQFILCDIGGFACALVVDSIVGTTVLAQPMAGWPEAAAGADFIAGVIHLPDGLCLMIDPARFLFAHEQEQLTQALTGAADAQR